MNKPTHIICHHSLTADGQTVSAGAIFDWHTGKHPESPFRFPYVGYDLLIEYARDRYHAIAGHPFGLVGYHTRGHNLDSVAICFVGNYDLAPPPDEMLTLGAGHIRGYLWAFGIQPSEIYGHRDFASYKSCPGERFDMDRLRAMI